MRLPTISVLLLLLLTPLWGGGCRCNESPATQDSGGETNTPSTPSTPSPPEAKPSGPFSLEFQSVGGAKIAAEIIPGKDPSSPVIIFVPSRDTSRAEWKPLVAAFQKTGHFSLVHYDSRGTGKSVHGTSESDDWSETDFILADVRGILNITKSRNEISPKSFVFIGSSVGGSAALRITLEDPLVKSVVLLSPGLSYLDLDVRETVKALQDRKMIAFASRGDKYATHSARTMTQLHPGASVIILEKGKSHGAAILHSHPEVIDQVVQWTQQENLDAAP